MISTINLELKIPPVIVGLIIALIMWVISLLTPEFSVSMKILQLIYTIPVFIGVFFIVAGIVSFRKAKTTIHPMKPEMATTLVTLGIYKITRNPIYLGALFFLIAWGLYLANAYSCMTTLLFVLYMNRFQIMPEETALKKNFGKEYSDYINQARRWL